MELGGAGPLWKHFQGGNRLTLTSSEKLFLSLDKTSHIATLLHHMYPYCIFMHLLLASV